MAGKEPESKHPPTYGWSQYERMRKMEETANKTSTPEPYTVPEGYKAPSMKELWQYAHRRHPYAQYGYGLVFLVGLGFYTSFALGKMDKAQQKSQEARRS